MGIGPGFVKDPLKSLGKERDLNRIGPPLIKLRILCPIGGQEKGNF